MHDFEKLGAFYLGAEYDLAGRTRGADPLLYDSKDLTTHAVCVGMTGSGKTGLCLALLEEAAIDGVPAIAIDPKGDLGNLLLAFPKLEPADFRPWIDESTAARNNLSPDELAAQTAELWRNGLAEWGEDGERIEKYRSTVDCAIYTPGSSAGLPLSVLRSFDAPPEAIRDDADLLRDRISADASGLLALVGIDADPITSREHILISQLLEAAWSKGQSLDLAALVHQVQDPPLTRVGSLDLETFYPEKQRTELAMRLNNLLASPGFAGWLEGEPLDVAGLLYTPEGKPRLSILSIAHLSEAERMFFVTILLNEVLAWVRTQSGTSSLRAILYMDEVFGYFPPVANPPSKKPMLTLLKQARAYGLGVVLATQNPVDLDYKGLSNTGTWFLGRLQTERDKARVLEGLEGASAEAGSTFNRAEMEATLAGLGSRKFLLNNVHEDRPVVFETRWCLSYLRGPMSRSQIQMLMAERKPPPAEEVAEFTHEVAAGEQPVETTSEVRNLAPAIEQVYVTHTAGEDAGPEVYRPALFGMAQLHFVDARRGVDCWRGVGVLVPGESAARNGWDAAEVLSPSEVEVEEKPREGVDFAPLPSELEDAKHYTAWRKSLDDYLYQHHRLTLWRAPALKEYSTPDETEADFRIRITQRARELRDEAVEKLRRKYAAKGATLDERIQKARERVARERSEAQTETVETAVSFGESILRALFGRKLASVTNVRRASTTARRASRAMKQRGDVARAQKALDKLMDQRADLEHKFEDEVDQFDADYREPKIEPYPIRPRKREIEVQKVALAWVVVASGEPPAEAPAV
ncbi:MAG: ATP-binding protein [Planctomycetota bacterium]|nr:MAG: ATP-binding protein [Planctomycetota bacterium]